MLLDEIESDEYWRASPKASRKQLEALDSQRPPNGCVIHHQVARHLFRPRRLLSRAAVQVNVSRKWPTLPIRQLGEGPFQMSRASALQSTRVACNLVQQRLKTSTKSSR